MLKYFCFKIMDFNQKLKYSRSMPKVLEINGYKYFFFSNEGNPQEPCHIHVRKAGNLAKFWIGNQVSLAENIGFSASELKEIKRIAAENAELIKEAWNEFFKRKC